MASGSRDEWGSSGKHLDESAGEDLRRGRSAGWHRLGYTTIVNETNGTLGA